MHMAISKKRIIHELNELRRQRGITQSELASQLRVSQPHLSRVMSGAVPPGNKLEFRMTKLLETTSAKNADHWMTKVNEAAKRSTAFRNLMNAALHLEMRSRRK